MRLIVMVILLFLGACADPQATVRSDAADASTGDTSSPVAIQFRLRAGDDPAGCGAPITGLGTTASTAQLKDARLFVSQVRLTGPAGDATVTLDEDGVWQHQGVALVDFEDGTGTCADGTASTHTAVTGTVPTGTYTGLEFTVGVPFAQNHMDSAKAKAPLNLTSMWWSWNGGYKFVKLDLGTSGVPGGWVVHLGSTGCVSSGVNTITSCANPNRPEIRLTAFDPNTQAVALDLAALLASSNVDVNGGGPAGCMAGASDPECPPLFAALGLASTGQPAGTQSAFKAVTVQGGP